VNFFVSPEAETVNWTLLLFQGRQQLHGIDS
jgi:hypothetical protein